MRAPLIPVGRAVHSFRAASLPPLARANYRREVGSLALMSAVVACVSGPLMGVMAQKAFHAGALVVAVLASAEALANITSLFWTRVLYGRDRVRATNLLQIGAIACALVIAAAPFNGAGTAMIVAATLLARCFLTGIISARTDLWRANYPRGARHRVTANLAVVATMIVSATSMLIALAMDMPAMGAHAFRPVYIAAAVCGLAGAAIFSRVRWRGRSAALQRERAPGASRHHKAGARAMLRILREDAHYRRFMSAQFVLGLPQLAATPVFLIALKDTFPRLDYTQSITLTQVLQMLMPVVTTPLWARVLDRTHVVRFRAYHSWLFVIANSLMAAGFLAGSLPVLYFARALLGAALAGGFLAWNLGHHDFASRETAPLYMGIHVTLTGVRGMVAPFLGLAMYEGFALSLGAPGAGLRSPALGPWTFFVLAAVGVAGALMFVRLHLDTRHAPRRTGPQD